MIRRVVVLAVALTFLGASSARSQDVNTAGSSKLVQGNFVVPDAPALKMLDVDASKILRPATVKALAASFASSTNDLNFLPKAFAVEFSPGLLKDGDTLSLKDYRAKHVWYRTRLSFASKRGDAAGARTNLAAAVRFSLDDKTDLRMDTNYTQKLLRLTNFKVDSLLLIEDLRNQMRIPVGVDPTAAQQTQITAAVVDAKLSSKALVSEVKKAAEEASWSSDVFDFAAGLRASSPDSTGKGARFDGVAGWLTRGWKLGKHAQLLIGGRGAYERELSDTLKKNDLAGAGDGVVRLYFGSNQYKMLAEAQGSGGQFAPKWLLNAGGELYLSKILWITASAGYKATGGTGGFVSSFKVHMTPPDA